MNRETMEKIKSMAPILGMISTLFVIVAFVSEKPILAVIALGIVLAAVITVFLGNLRDTLLATLTLAVAGIAAYLWLDTGSITGVVFVDFNGNGRKDWRDTPISGVEISLFDKDHKPYERGD